MIGTGGFGGCMRCRPAVAKRNWCVGLPGLWWCEDCIIETGIGRIVVDGLCRKYEPVKHAEECDEPTICHEVKI
jgi:hypothetical protein